MRSCYLPTPNIPIIPTCSCRPYLFHNHLGLVRLDLISRLALQEALAEHIVNGCGARSSGAICLSLGPSSASLPCCRFWDA